MILRNVLRFVCLFVVLFGSSQIKAQKCSVEGHESADAFTCQFELEGGLIFVKASINGVDGDFILDSGAPCVVLNSVHFHDIDSTRSVAKGVNGTMRTQQIQTESFSWGGIKKYNSNFMGLDLSHLEKGKERKIVGLIGQRLLENYELLIDYKKSELSIFKKGASKYHTGILPKQEIDFVYEGHIPVMKGIIGGKEYFWGLDTGAEANLIGQSAYSKLEEKCYKLSKSETSLSGADKNELKVRDFKLRKMYLSGQKYKKMRFVTTDISHLNEGYGMHIDGLLGYPFLSYYKFSIDFANRKLFIW